MVNEVLCSNLINNVLFNGMEDSRVAFAINYYLQICNNETSTPDIFHLRFSVINKNILHTGTYFIYLEITYCRGSDI